MWPRRSRSRELEDVRRRFAEELRKHHDLRSEALVRAFAAVPRERFLGRGPWLLLAGAEGYTSSTDADPAHLYQDCAVAIDAPRVLNNGQPGLLAMVMDALELTPGTRVVHVGCGTGYYTAILAELVGRRGRVVALELDPEIAVRARRNLRGLPQVEVVAADALEHDPGPTDAILVNAGMTHPHPLWLDRLRPNGRLALPLTAVRPPAPAVRFVRNHAGQVLLVTRRTAGFEAHFVTRVGIPALFGGRDPENQRRLAQAYARGGGQEVRSLRRGEHGPEPSCWCHARGFCLSLRNV